MKICHRNCLYVYGQIFLLESINVMAVDYQKVSQLYIEETRYADFFSAVNSISKNDISVHYENQSSYA